METQRPKVNDIVKIFCSDLNMSWYYGKVMAVKDEGIDVMLPPKVELFSYKANCIVVVGHEEPMTNVGWAYVGNLEEKKK